MSLVPLGSLAKRFGVKAVCYGPAGGGKTPVLCTAPRPVILVTEPGMLSVRDVMNVPAWDAINNPKMIVDFFKWLNSSAEAKGFDTVGMDSLSQMAELILREELGRNKDGRKAYGEMSRRVMEHMENLFYMPQKHTFLIAKQQIIEVGEGKFKQPYFPGQDLGVKIPHLFDEFWQLDMHRVPGVPQPVKALLTRQRFDTMARDRSGNLDEYEQPDLTNVFRKAMAA